MELMVEYAGGLTFRTRVRGHELLCDQPPENGGQDAGMSPPEFLLASLGTCAGFYTAQYLKTRNLPAAELKVKVTAEKAADKPARLGSFRIEVTVPGLVDERHREGVLRAVKSCLIHNTLMHPPAIEIALETPVAEMVVGH
jgi:uncharacterized OsmC-like protein